MKTFDIAVKYIQQVDLWDVDIYSVQPNNLLSYQKELLDAYKLFQSNPYNKSGNETYRATCFEAALAYRLDYLHYRGEYKDCWTRAKEIAQANRRGFSFLKKKWGNTNYPLKMMNEWSDYCQLRIPAPFYLNERTFYNYGNTSIIITAWDYLCDK